MVLKSDSLFMCTLLATLPTIAVVHLLDSRDFGKLRHRSVCSFAPRWHVSGYWKMPVALHSRRLGFERATHLVSLPEVFDLTLE